MGNVTINGDLTGTAVGGLVGGAANLTTAGAIPYVSSAGVLNQTANLSFDVANNRLVLGSATVQRFSTDLSLSRASAGVLQVGDGGANANGQVSARAVNAVSSLAAFNSTGGIYMSGNAGSSWGTIQSYSDGSGTAKATAINPTGGNLLIGTTTDDGSNKLQVSGSARVLSAGIATLKVDGGTTQGQWATGTGFSSIGTVTNDPLVFYTNNVNAARFAPTTGNLLVGTSTDLGYGLHAANKGTNGNLLVFDPTATTGTTKAVFKEGAGQSTTASTEWQDSAGAFTARVQAGGGFQSKVAYSVIDSGATVNHIGLYTTGLSIASGKPIAFSATTEATATKDLSLSRASAGVLQVGDGGSNANGAVSLTRSQHAGVLVAALPAAAAGNAGSIQYVTDANATTIGSTVAGGGANKVMVWSDGAAWKIFAS